MSVLLFRFCSFGDVGDVGDIGDVGDAIEVAVDVEVEYDDPRPRESISSWVIVSIFLS